MIEMFKKPGWRRQIGFLWISPCKLWRFWVLNEEKSIILWITKEILNKNYTLWLDLWEDSEKIWIWGLSWKWGNLAKLGKNYLSQKIWNIIFCQPMWQIQHKSHQRPHFGPLHGEKIRWCNFKEAEKKWSKNGQF